MYEWTVTRDGEEFASGDEPEVVALGIAHAIMMHTMHRLDHKKTGELLDALESIINEYDLKPKPPEGLITFTRAWVEAEKEAEDTLPDAVSPPTSG